MNKRTLTNASREKKYLDLNIEMFTYILPEASSLIAIGFTMSNKRDKKNYLVRISTLYLTIKDNATPNLTSIGQF